MVNGKIRRVVSHVPPSSFVNYDAADLFSAPNETDKMRNDRAFHAPLEKIDKCRLDDVNAGEKEFVARAGRTISRQAPPASARNARRRPSPADGAGSFMIAHASSRAAAHAYVKP